MIPIEADATGRHGREGSAYLRATRMVIAVTLLFCVGESGAGAWAGSAFMTKDGIEWGYGLLIYAIGLATYGRSRSACAWGGYVSAAILGVGGLQGLVELVSSLLRYEPDDSLTSVAISAIVSLVGSGIVAAILLRFRRSTDPVVSASWFAARNDVVTSALGAAVTLSSRVTDARWLEAAVTALGVLLSFAACYAVAREAAALPAATAPETPP